MPPSDRSRDAQPTLVHDDGRVLVADKPPGLPATGRDRDDPDSLEHLLALRAGRTVWAVHQLDADTSGVIVFVTRKSLGGIVTDLRSRALNEKDQPIPGLYAVGESAGFGGGGSHGGGGGGGGGGFSL